MPASGVLTKRYTVPVLPLPNSPTTWEPTTSPRKTNNRPTARRTKGGLVHGTGLSVPPPRPTPATPIKTRTVVDQAPTPLYCSDECKMNDLSSYNYPPPMPPVHDSPSNCDLCNAESDFDCSTSPAHSHCHRRLIPFHNHPPIIYSTLGESTTNSHSLTSISAASSLLSRMSDVVSTEELSSKFSEFFTRRLEHRANLYPSLCPHSGMATAPRRERSLVHPDVQGKLLVPDVKLIVQGGSSRLPPNGEGSSVGEKPRRHQDSDRSEHESEAAFSLPVAHRPLPTAQMYSDNLYPMMPLVNPVQKHIEPRIIDGVEQDVEVEVVQPLKRLFRFAGEERPHDRQRLLRPSRS